MLHVTDRRPVAIRALLLLVAFVVLCPLLIRSAAAQVLPLVPEPVTTPELMEYGEDLGLSSQQQLRLLTIHDDYKLRYREFEDRDIKTLQDELIDIATNFMRTGFAIPEREIIESLIDRYQTVLARVQTIDRSLFDAMAGMLSEEQAPRLQRVRIARELLIYRELVREFAGEMNRGARVNISEMALDLDLEPEEREQVDLILIPYETALLARSRSIYSVLTDATKVTLDTIDQLRLREMTPNQLMEFFQDEETQQSLMATFDEESKPFQAAAFEVSQLNLRTFRRLETVLSPEHAAELRDRYFRRGYREVYSGPGAWREHYRIALESEALTSQQAEAVRGERTRYAQQDDQITNQLVDLAEASREYRTTAQMSGMVGDSRQEKIDDLVARRTTLGTNADSALRGIVGPELIAEIIDDGEQTGRAGSGQGRRSGRGEQQIIVEAQEAAAVDGTERKTPVDPALPAAMSEADLARLTGALAWSEEDASVLHLLYEDYREEYETVRTTPPDAAEHDAADHDLKPRARKNRRVEMLKALAEVDGALFDNIEALVADDQEQRLVRWSRGLRKTREVQEVSRTLMRTYGQEEAGIDLVMIILESGLDSAGLDSIDEVVRGYESRLDALLASRLDMAQESNLRSELMKEMREGDSAAGRQLSEAMMKKWQETYQEMQTMNRRIERANREALDQVAAALSSDAAWAIRYTYKQTAYPDIYRDGEKTEKVFRAALELQDLAPAQREQINEIAMEYRGAFYSMCDRMVEIRQQRDFNFSDFQMPDRAMIEREIEGQRLEYDREEVAARAKARLKLLLTPEQRQRIPDVNR